jgi:hypothetical protein
MTKNAKQTNTVKKETRPRGPKSDQPDWMVDPKKAAMKRAKNRNLRGCYSTAVIIFIAVVVVALIYVTIRQ